MGEILVRKSYEENFIWNGFQTVRVKSEAEIKVEFDGDISGSDAKSKIKDMSDKLYKMTRALTKRDLADVMKQVEVFERTKKKS